MNKKEILGIMISAMFIASVFAITVGSQMGNTNSEKNNMVNNSCISSSISNYIKNNQLEMNGSTSHSSYVNGNTVSIRIASFSSKVGTDKYYLVDTTFNGIQHAALFISISSAINKDYVIYILNVNVIYSASNIHSFTSTSKVNRSILNHNSTATNKYTGSQISTGKIIAPDISASAGWLGWAVSFTGANMKGLYYTIYKAGYTGIYSAIVGYIVQMGISGSLAGPIGVVAGIIAGVIISIGFYYLYQYDMSHGNPGVYFAAYWQTPLTLDVWGLNPVPWYF